ncbi:MAG TPA: Sapep family Mn(2+)-dependent dipeptidase [Candidatus Acidoferrum sp.]|nr:Sapep family Mn(2+)-dependent dipeptidase [Candidatus Acidoferrum sp.]
MEFKTLAQQYREEMLKTLAELVAIPSVEGKPEPGAPFGPESAAALAYMLDKAKALGLKAESVDNYCGFVEWGDGDELLIACHLDVVPAGEGWTTPPFEASIRDGKMYGRGVSDNKGQAVGALYGLKALSELGLAPKRKVRIFLGTQEESGMKDIDYYLTKQPLPEWGIVPDMEYPIYNKEKGGLGIRVHYKEDGNCAVKRFKCGGATNILPDKATAVLCGKQVTLADTVKALEAYNAGKPYKILAEEKDGDILLTGLGKSCHAAEPWNGFNAIFNLAGFLYEFLGEKAGNAVKFIVERYGMTWDGALFGVKCEDDTGPLTLNVGIIELECNKGFNTIDIRYPSTLDGEKIYNAICESVKDEPVELEMTRNSAPLMVPNDDPHIQMFADIYTRVTGRPSSLNSSGGGTYARKLHNRAVSFGSALEGAPGHNIHGIDEFLVIDEFMLHNEIYLNAMYEWLFK